MAGPIVMSALRAMRQLVCPHCGARQLRAPQATAYRVCSRCHRRFSEPAARGKKPRTR